MVPREKVPSAHILDTGIMISHVEFEGRASNGWNGYPGTSFDDTNGHGTHVAGIIGSRKYGVAKKANLISVKILNGSSGSTSVIIEGISWAVNDVKSKGRVSKVVLNLSIGGAYSQALNNAVKSAYDNGILTTVASGNEAQDVSKVSPASTPEAITVGAIDSSYRMASSSNFGPGLDIFAPGVLIQSTWIGSTTASNTISGSSVAAPHVAGVLLYFQSLMAGQSPDAIRSYMIKVAIKDAISGVPPNTPDLLVYNGSSP